MKLATITIFLIIALSVNLNSKQINKKFVVYIYGNEVNRENLKTLSKLKIYAIVTNNYDALSLIKEFNFKAIAILMPFKLIDREYIRDINGSIINYGFGSGCPNSEKIRNKSLEKIETLLLKGFDGISLDVIRYPSLSEDSHALSTCFCKSCIIKMGKDLKRFKKIASSISVKNLPLDWLAFRSNCIVEYCTLAYKLVKKYNAELWLDVFSPSFAPLVAQDLKRLSQVADIIQPMIYTRGSGIACLATEIKAIARALDKNEQDALIKTYKLLGLPQNLPTKFDKLDRLPDEVITSEVKKANTLCKCKVIPLIFIENCGKDEIKSMINATNSEIIGLFHCNKRNISLLTGSF